MNEIFSIILVVVGLGVGLVFGLGVELSAQRRLAKMSHQCKQGARP